MSCNLFAGVGSCLQFVTNPTSVKCNKMRDACKILYINKANESRCSFFISLVYEATVKLGIELSSLEHAHVSTKSLVGKLSAVLVTPLEVLECSEIKSVVPSGQKQNSRLRKDIPTLLIEIESQCFFPPIQLYH